MRIVIGAGASTDWGGSVLLHLRLHNLFIAVQVIQPYRNNSFITVTLYSPAMNGNTCNGTREHPCAYCVNSRPVHRSQPHYDSTGGTFIKKLDCPRNYSSTIQDVQLIMSTRTPPRPPAHPPPARSPVRSLPPPHAYGANDISTPTRSNPTSSTATPRTGRFDITITMGHAPPTNTSVPAMGKFALEALNKRKRMAEPGRGGVHPPRDNYIIFDFHYEGSLTWPHVFNAWAARQYLAAEIYLLLLSN